jgi:hypothetical protein
MLLRRVTDHVNLLEVQWRTGVAERTAELRGRLEG